MNCGLVTHPALPGWHLVIRMCTYVIFQGPFQMCNILSALSTGLGPAFLASAGTQPAKECAQCCFSVLIFLQLFKVFFKTVCA